MRKRLRELGINEFFAVQTALLPFLLPPQRRSRALYCPYDPPRDVCASAPTGSGKTLAYVIPIVEILSSRIATRLRALIVLPTRDLVLQVQETFEAVSKGRGLKIAVATGQHSFVHEQTQLVSEQGKTLQGGSSKVDILICTPGRLIDHLAGTPGFTLQHLRFLVIDEADRLLAQSFQDWLAQVLAALRPPTRSTSIDGDVDDPKHASCQKLLFSATLTRDPARIAALGLRDAKYFVVQGRSGEGADGEDAVAALGTEEFAMPEGLKEHYLTIPSARKPLVLFHLVHAHGVSNALVFTKSSASTARLVPLPGPAKRIVTQAYSSDLAPGERRTILEKFKRQEIDILICSDLVARGLDIPHVAHVVSYDAPVDARKYVVRADAWTLVEDQEAHFFKNMLRGAGRLERVARERVKEKDLEGMERCYEIALEKLREAYSRTTS
ncbi:DEAD-domain-containing protein [Phellopilus nigrolimitatus]|nr:DEAD-domain-containing protein [Phellopilus nigrolimitatus]